MVATTRRAFLRLVGGVGAAAALSSCSKRQQSGSTDDITLLTSGWPVSEPHKASEIKDDPGLKAYNDALHSWMHKNPGVTVKQAGADFPDQQTLVTAITGGTAPAWYEPGQVGDYNQAATFSAFLQGLMADITGLVHDYRVKDKLVDYAERPWTRSSQIGGKYFAYPIDFGIGSWIEYRKDLVEDLDLPQPEPGWTWEDAFALVRGLASGKRKGAGFAVWVLASTLDANGFGLLTHLPTPDTSWNWTYRGLADRQWVQRAEAYRKLRFTEKVIFSDVDLTWDNYISAFVKGTTGVTYDNSYGYFGSGSSLEQLAKREGKDRTEVVGFMELPYGDLGQFTSQTITGAAAFNPDLSDDALDKAVSLVDYMFLGEGRTIQKAGAYEATKDLRSVYNIPLQLDGATEFKGVPGTFQDAWGEDVYQQALRIARIPPPPDSSTYIPAEKAAGPSGQPMDDLWSALSYEAHVDVAAALQDAQDKSNAQARGFTSSVPDEKFVSSAKDYYAALLAFWKQHAPRFHDEVLADWYDQTILPALGG